MQNDIFLYKGLTSDTQGELKYKGHCYQEKVPFDRVKSLSEV